MQHLILSLLLMFAVTACDNTTESTPARKPAALGEEDSAELQLPAPRLTDAEQSEVDAMALPPPPAWLGDLDVLQKKRVVRVLVPYSKTFYLIDRGKQMGVIYDLGKSFETWLNQNKPYSDKAMRWHVMFIPTPRDQLLPRLQEGFGDVAAGALTITPGRLKTVDFASPLYSDVKEMLVTGPGSPNITRLEDLSGQQVYVRQSSSYNEHLLELNQHFGKQGLDPVKIVPANENLETEDLLQMVNAGLFGITVADEHIARLWQPIYTDLKIHEEFYLHEGGEISWALRHNSPQLMQALDQFFQKHQAGTEFGNIMQRRFFNNTERLLDATSAKDMQRFNALVGLFEKYAMLYDFDHLMLMAQAFQESQLKQSARSHMGAVGVMQVLPSTAREMGITNVAGSAERNIEAGSKYLRMIADRYLNDPAISPENATLLSFAAYNAGPANLLKFRRLAEKSGLDPNVWFGNVEQAAARIVGRETVDYVGNIYKYYVVYKLAEQTLRQRELATQPDQISRAHAD